MRTRVAEVSVVGRNTQGVKVIGVSANEKLIKIEKVVESESDEDDGLSGLEAETTEDSRSELSSDVSKKDDGDATEAESD